MYCKVFCTGLQASCLRSQLVSRAFTVKGVLGGSHTRDRGAIEALLLDRTARRSHICIALLSLPEGWLESGGIVAEGCKLVMVDSCGIAFLPLLVDFQLALESTA